MMHHQQQIILHPAHTLLLVGALTVVFCTDPLLFVVCLELKLPTFSDGGDGDPLGQLSNPQTPSSSMFVGVKTPKCLHISPGMFPTINRYSCTRPLSHGCPGLICANRRLTTYCITKDILKHKMTVILCTIILHKHVLPVSMWLFLIIIFFLLSRKK